MNWIEVKKADKKENFVRIFETYLTDEQKQTDLMEMIEIDDKQIKDCLKAIGMSESKWEQMWGKPKR